MFRGNRFERTRLPLAAVIFALTLVLIASSLKLTTGRAAAGSLGGDSLRSERSATHSVSQLKVNGKIAFARGPGSSNNDIYLMDADGSNQARIGAGNNPRWSPNGARIAFINGSPYQIYSMNANGSDVRRLSHSTQDDGFPAWSPDGTKIAFVSGNLNDAATFEIYVMNADGTNRTRLTNNSVADAWPNWSPDGTKIVFMSGRTLLDPNSFEIFIMNADGNNRTQLTNNSILDAQPSFSPDGTKILFVSGDAGNPPGVGIYVMNADGNNKTQLTHNSMTDGFPAWSPDGTKIVFASGDPFDGKTVELYVMNADGSNPVRLTNNSLLDWFPDWQPVTNSFQFSTDSYSVGEGAGSATITVNRSGDTSGAVTVDFATSDGTATQAKDYEVASGTLSFAAGDTSKTFTVLIVDDANVENNETLNVTLKNPTGANLGSPSQATVTIIDNDTTGSTSPAAKQFVANLTGASEVPPTNNAVKGNGGIVQLSADEASAKVSLIFSGLSSAETAAHIHGPADKTHTAPIIFPLPTTNPVNDSVINPTTQQVADLKAGLHYMNVHSTTFPDGEIRGQLQWNPLEEANFFVRQQYLDFLSREPDPGGFSFWISVITQCNSAVQCLRDQRVAVSNAFFYELEYQQTASFVQRIYRAAYGNNQPNPNPNADPNFPNEEKKMPSYAVFVADRARVVGGANLAQSQQDLANAFVQRPEFLAKYPANLNLFSFVDAVLTTIKNDIGVDLSSQRFALLSLGNGLPPDKARGAVMYRLANDDGPQGSNGGINNRAFIDAEYNRSFVLGQYFGYLRRDPDIGGFIFWLGQVSSGPLRDVPKQHSMVCSFTTSAEYQLRFGPVASRNNNECPQ
jgi:Tol biopolymer transport system component